MCANANRISSIYIAKPETAAEIRSTFRSFLESLNMNKDQIWDALMAMGEIIINSIEHAYHGTDGFIKVSAHLEDNILTLIIEDFGDWLVQEQPVDIKRGRGLMIAEALTTTFYMQHKSEGGTKTYLKLKIA